MPCPSLALCVSLLAPTFPAPAGRQRATPRGRVRARECLRPSPASSMMAQWVVTLGVCALLLLGPAAVHGLSFDLHPDESKCIHEDVHKDVLVVGTYSISDNNADTHAINLDITDSRGSTVYAKAEAHKGKFAFTSDNYDVFEICFHSEHEGVDPKSFRTVTLDVKMGPDARNYDDLAKASKLKPMELELRKLEDLAESLVQDFARMKKREMEHRDTNESTNERMLHFSVFSMVCLLALAVWQVLYLKRYFKQKKLID